MNYKLFIMFDLEQTIVDSWHSATPLYKKIAYMHSIIPTLIDHDIYGSVEYGVFSFACDLPSEKQMARNLASHMNLPISTSDIFVPCWKDLEDLVHFRVDLQKWEIVNLFGKDGMFDIWTRQFPEYDFVLFDDCLPHKETVIIRDEQKITKIRV